MGNSSNRTQRGASLKSGIVLAARFLAMMLSAMLLVQTGISHAAVAGPPAPPEAPQATSSEAPSPEYTGPGGTSTSSRITVSGAMQPYVAAKAALDLIGIRDDGVEVRLDDIYCDITRGSREDPLSRDTFACSVSLSDGDYLATIKAWDAGGVMRTANGSFSVAVPLRYGGPAGTIAVTDTTVTASMERFVARKARLDLAGTRADGAPIEMHDLYCEITRGYPDSFACPVSLAEGSYAATVKTWDENGFLRTAEGGFTVALKPLLRIRRGVAYWPGYADYLARELAVEIAVTNESQTAAFDLRLAAAGNSDGVTVISPMPLGIGDVAAGGQASALLSYHVPAGVSVFRSQLTASASNQAGTLYRYP